MGNSSMHDHDNLPDSGRGRRGVRHEGRPAHPYKNGKPLANLHLTLLDRVGVQSGSFGDSNGKIEDLFDPVAV